MVAEILNVTEKAVFDNAIINADKHTHQPYANSTFKNNDTIRIPIENEDVYTLPCGSFLYIEGRLLKKDGTVPTNTTFINNGILYLFDEIRYELGGKVIDRVRNPGMTTTMKGYASYNENESKRLINSGWLPPALGAVKGVALHTRNLIDTNGYFNVCIPLRMILGFGEDFRKIILNIRQELVLVRSSTDNNALFCSATPAEEVDVHLDQICWKIPHVSVADAERLKLLRYVDRNLNMELSFRSWELHEYPLLNQSYSHNWTVKTTSQLEKPRFIIFGFQTDKGNDITKNKSVFDHCDLTNFKVHLGSTMYPYDNLNLDFDLSRFAVLYEMYVNFQQSYYGNVSEPLFDPKEFRTIAPLVIVDCSYQNEIVKSGSIDIRLEIQTKRNIPDKTAAYCLIIHDRVIRYNPSTNLVQEV
ncbi:uncharacterized protein LOC112905851 isoform X1 [Agrilus planipennis]|uniref:Uncharacterized protein LOC112905851 isoform X1 n=1 Tax=Agrilus planipennis TaxID=224129 RepID=A0A7F5RFT7_AGRPL|nr:uncharacterized protein LOC112905851 isoform X1 [Agrilus planipennis]